MNTEKNLLLLSMSTLNYPVESCYEGPCSEKECYFHGVSQLEIGTKYYLRKIEKRKKKIDKIFIVESPQARADSVKMNDIDSFLTEPLFFVHPIKDSDGDLSTNAVDFYKERIAQYIRGTEQLGESVKYEKLPVEKMLNYEKEEQVLSDTYSQEFILGDFFTDIVIPEASDEDEDQEDLLNMSVQDLCNQIKHIAEDNITVNLYLDMQGGQRYGTFIINAAVNMLDIYSSIKVKQAVAIDYHKDNNKNGLFNQIIDTTFNDRIFKMVSGMNQFITTGRGDILRQFFNKSQYLDSVDLTSENPIITSINNISDALAVCNMSKFNTEIDNFKTALNKYKASQKPNRLFQIFVEDLEADYNKYGLLNDKVASPIVNRVKWCASKSLYQQAMTLLEAHVPDDIVKNKIIYYGNDKDLKNLVKTMKERKWIEVSGSYISNAYVLIHCVLSYLDNSEDAFTWKLNDHYIEKPLEQKFSATFGRFDYDSRTNKEVEESVEPKFWNCEIGELLLHYDEIRNIRNKINHSNDYVYLKHDKAFKDGKSKLITAELVRRKIKEFIDCYDSLIEKKVRVDLSKQFSVIPS